MAEKERNNSQMRKPEGPERRTVVRSKREILVRYRIQGLSQTTGLQVVKKPHEDISRTKNISENGILFTTSQSLPLKTVLDIRLQLPLQKETIALEGRVVGCEQIVKDLIYAIRIEFIKLGEEKKNLLKSFVQIFKSKGK